MKISTFIKKVVKEVDCDLIKFKISLTDKAEVSNERTDNLIRFNVFKNRKTKKPIPNEKIGKVATFYCQKCAREIINGFEHSLKVGDIKLRICEVCDAKYNQDKTK